MSFDELLVQVIATLRLGEEVYRKLGYGRHPLGYELYCLAIRVVDEMPRALWQV